MADPVTMMIMAAGTAIKAGSELQQGRTQRGMMDAEAASLQQRGNWERAMGTYKQAERERETKKLLSQQIAAAAASGGGTGGSAEEVMGETRQRGTFLQLLDQAQAEETGRGLDDQARLRRFAGREAERGAKLKALGTVLSGASSMMTGKFGEGMPSGGDSWTRGTTVTRYQ